MRIYVSDENIGVPGVNLLYIDHSDRYKVYYISDFDCLYFC